MGSSGRSGDVTAWLLDLRSPESSRQAKDRLFVAVYDELRRIASDLMRRERPEHTLRPTALVHEAYIRLVGKDQVSWESRAHFFGIAARAMRQILVDHARAKASLKRGGGYTRVSLDDHLEVAASSHELIDVDSALEKLAGINERIARVVELKIFGGMEMREIAHVLEVSKRTVEGDWTFARLWLARELPGGSSLGNPSM